MLRFNCAHGQRQRFLVLADGNKTRTQVADKLHVEHFVTLNVKLFQSPLQQRNPRAEIILKEQPLTSQASRYGTVGLQGVDRSELGQLRDVLLRPARVRQGQIYRKNQVRDRHSVAG